MEDLLDARHCGWSDPEWHIGRCYRLFFDFGNFGVMVLVETSGASADEVGCLLELTSGLLIWLSLDIFLPLLDQD